jgi:hypothetical protein
MVHFPKIINMLDRAPIGIFKYLDPPSEKPKIRHPVIDENMVTQ